MPFTIKNLTDLAKVAVENGASDIHLRSDEVPCLRIRGELVSVQTRQFSINEMEDICRIIIPKAEIFNNLDKVNELDGSFDIPDLCRFRFNFFRYNKKIGIIFRIVKMTIPSIDELKLPAVIKDIASQRRGLILVTGATGSGKSTTLAAMINHINLSRFAHIVTVEDPIEYIHPQIKSRISQREIGSDTKDFSSALRAALRQDPDVILIGELRDSETIDVALKAAETGHAVFATLHTTDAISTIGRIISMFSPDQQEEVRKRLSNNLYATIGQRMLKSKKNSMVVAQEIMINNPSIKECIMGEQSLRNILSIIAKSYKSGGNTSRSFDQHLLELYQKDVISKETAIAAATSENDFLQKLIID